jgi:hypothetical protein
MTFDIREVPPVQYVLFIYQGTTPTPDDSERWNALSEETRQAIYAGYGEINRTPGVTPGVGLKPPAAAVTVHVENGKAITKPGPYAPGDGGVSGYLVLEADSMDHAVAIAAKIPAAQFGGGIEIREAASW